MGMTVEIPEKLVPLLEQRASAVGKAPEALVVAIVEKELTTASAPKPLSERERIRAIFKEAGLLSEVDPDLVRQYVKPHTPEEVEEMRHRLQPLSFSPTFSE